MTNLTLLTGGTRSGKSAQAERLAASAATPAGVAYLATGDASLGERITAHQARRPAAWETIDVGRDPAAAIARAGERTVLLDGLGAWIAAELHHAGAFADDGALELATSLVRRGTGLLLDAIEAHPAPVIVVCEEAGLSPVAPDAATRRWVDLVGEAAQALAARADRALLVVAGRVLELPPQDATGLLLPDPLGAADAALLGLIPDGPGRPWRGDPLAPLHAVPDPVDALDAPPDARELPRAGPAGGVPPAAAEASAPRSPAGAATPGAEAAPLATGRPVHGDRMVPDGHEDAAVNVLPGGPPPWLTRVLRDALDGTLGRYPDERLAARALAARHGLPAGRALALNGAAEAFWLLAAALTPRRAVVLTPSFTEPATALQAAKHPVELLARSAADGFAIPPGLVPDDADLVLVGNPCNPTGCLHTAASIAALARPGRTLAVDESFMDLVEGERESLAGRTDLPGLVVLRSLTKSLAIPGLRAGYLLAAPELVAAFGARRQSWPVNALALAALTAFAARPTATAAQAERVARDRELLVEELRELGPVDVHPAHANFLLLGVPDGARVRRRLAEQRIAVRPTEDLGLDANHLRVAVRGGDADARLLEALRVALEVE